MAQQWHPSFTKRPENMQWWERNRYGFNNHEARNNANAEWDAFHNADEPSELESLRAQVQELQQGTLTDVQATYAGTVELINAEGGGSQDVLAARFVANLAVKAMLDVLRNQLNLEPSDGAIDDIRHTLIEDFGIAKLQGAKEIADKQELLNAINMQIQALVGLQQPMQYGPQGYQPPQYGPQAPQPQTPQAPQQHEQQFVQQPQPSAPAPMPVLKVKDVQSSDDSSQDESTEEDDV